MRGHDQQTEQMFSYLLPEQRVPADHPLRAIRQMTDRVLARLSQKFTRMYSTIGRPSIAPENLLRALLLQLLVVSTVFFFRSEAARRETERQRETAQRQSYLANVAAADVNLQGGATAEATWKSTTLGSAARKRGCEAADN